MNALVLVCLAIILAGYLIPASIGQTRRAEKPAGSDLAETRESDDATDSGA